MIMPSRCAHSCVQATSCRPRTCRRALRSVLLYEHQITPKARRLARLALWSRTHSGPLPPFSVRVCWGHCQCARCQTAAARRPAGGHCPGQRLGDAALLLACPAANRKEMVIPRTIHAATQTYHLPGELFTPEERAALAESTLPPELLHQCRFGRLEYDWRPTATVGRFLCRGCGISGLCGACAELAGQRIPPGVVPCLCALHGGLLEIGISAVALAVNVPATPVHDVSSAHPYRPQCHAARGAARKEEDHDTIEHLTQITLLS